MAADSGCRGNKGLSSLKYQALFASMPGAFSALLGVLAAVPCLQPCTLTFVLQLSLATPSEYPLYLLAKCSVVCSLRELRTVEAVEKRVVNATM